MKKPSDKRMSVESLRERAERKHASSFVKDVDKSESQRQLHELQVHQIELEMQNEELHRAQIAERRHYRYTELFEFAPVAYFAFALSGLITQVNLRGVNILGIGRANLLGMQFSNYVREQDRDTFERCLAKVFEGDGRQVAEIVVQVDRRELFLSIEANLGVTSTDCLVAMTDITDIKNIEGTLQADREFYQAITNNGMAIIWMAGLDKGCFYFNRPWLEFTGRSLEQEQGNGWTEGVHPDDFDRCVGIYIAAFDNQQEFSMIYRLRRHDGEYRWIIDKGVPRYDSSNKFIGYVGHCLDVTESKLAEQKLTLAAYAFTHALEGMMITDTKGNIIGVNEAFTSITGYSQEDVMGQSARILLTKHQSSALVYNAMREKIAATGQWYGEVWNQRKNGEVYQEILTIHSVHNDAGELQNYIGMLGDISVMKKNIQKLEQIANYDLLTNLPNRSLLADRLSLAMKQCNRQQQSLAVVFLDLDGFKDVNDLHGHDMGDDLLIALSLRMKEALREGDTLARIGGDEFVAVLTDLVEVEDCDPVLKRFLLAASEPVTIGEVVLKVSASIGVTLYPQDNVDTDILLRHADQAMYVAKELGKNRYHLFDTAQDDAVKVQRESLEDIRNGLDNQQFVLYYQPKVNMRTGLVMGFEALIRWQHPIKGLLNPLEFLPVIESHTMMIEMGEWVIDTALTQISQWQEMGLKLPVSASVNIAAVQLQQSDFVDRLTTLLAAHPDVEPRYLELEVLETSALDDITSVSATMNACIALGVNFALDDFGTGYSSLTYLRHLPASLIKIDQSFVRDMLVDADDLAIVEGVIALAKTFKRDVIAEGVETVEHGTALLQLGCELAQGYGIAKPMPASDIPKWASEWKPDDEWKS